MMTKRTNKNQICWPYYWPLEYGGQYFKNNNYYPLSILSEDEWWDLECLYEACQAAITDGGLFRDTDVDERGENERQSENDCEMKTVS